MLEIERNLAECAKGDELRAVLRDLRVGKGLKLNAEMIRAWIAVWQADPQRVLALLSPAERDLLAEAAHGETGEVDIELINAKYGHAYRYPRHSEWRKGRPILFFLRRNEFDASSTLLPCLREPLRALLPKPAAPEVRTLAGRPERGEWHRKRFDGTEEVEHRPLAFAGTEARGPVEARRAMQLVAAGRVAVSDKTGLPGTAGVKVMTKILDGPDFALDEPRGRDRHYKVGDEDCGPIRAAVWPVLLQQCGWAKQAGGKLVPTAAGKALLADATLREYVEGVRRWVQDERFDEFERIASIRGKSGRGGRRGMTDAADRRTAICDGLAGLTPGAWVACMELHRLMTARGTPCRVTTDAGGLYFCEPQYGTLSGYESEIGAMYLRLIALEALAVFGVVDLAYAAPHRLFPGFRDTDASNMVSYVHRSDGVYALSLTPLGAHILGLTDTYEPPRPVQRAVWHVLPNLDVVTPVEACFAAGDRATLARMAVPISDAVWHLDRDTVLEALAEGANVEELRDALAGGAEGELPATALDFFAGIERKLALLAGTDEAVLVTFADAATAALVLSDTDVRKIALPAGDRAVVIRASNRGALRTALKRMGMLIP